MMLFAGTSCGRLLCAETFFRTSLSVIMPAGLPFWITIAAPALPATIAPTTSSTEGSESELMVTNLEDIISLTALMTHKSRRQFLKGTHPYCRSKELLGALG